MLSPLTEKCKHCGKSFSDKDELIEHLYEAVEETDDELDEG